MGIEEAMLLQALKLVNLPKIEESARGQFIALLTEVFPEASAKDALNPIEPDKFVALERTCRRLGF